MPTYGWIREDNLEAFYAGTERVVDPGPPPRPSLHCPFCTAVVSDRKELQDHVSERHRVERPAFLIRGREPSPDAAIRIAPRKSDIVVTNVTSARVSIDGGKLNPIRVEELPRIVSQMRLGELSLVLANDSQPGATAVTTSYRISVRIAVAHELRDVERAFLQFIVNEPISRDAIDRFLTDRRAQESGREYATGLAEYALGVLLKERPDSEALTTPFARYREAFGSSLETLADFDRPLAILTTDLIRFSLNDFSRTSTRTGFWELDLANVVLKDPGEKTLPSPPAEGITRRPICPIDHATSRILNAAARLILQTRWSPILDDECRRLAESELLDPTDRQKVLALWAAAAWRLGAKESSVEPLRQISAVYPFSAWAEPFLESTDT